MDKKYMKYNSLKTIKFIRSFYPITLLRKVYLSISLFLKKGLFNNAASGAFYFLLSIIPIVLLFVYVVDISISGYTKLSDFFFMLLAKFNPQISKDFFKKIGLLNSNVTTLFGVFGIIGLIWSSRSVFSSMGHSFDLIFNSGSRRNFIINNIIYIIFVPIVFLLVVLLFFGSLLLNTLATFFQKYHIPILDNSQFIHISTSVFTLFLIFFISFLIYRFLPANKPTSSDAVIGAVLFTVSIQILHVGLSNLIHIANYYLLYGVISTLIVALYWMYITFVLFYIFAQLVYVRNKYIYLEFLIYYSNNILKSRNFLESLLFKSADTTIKKFAKFYKKDSVIFNIGDKANYLYIVITGTVSIKNEIEHSDAIIDLCSHQIFGECGVLDIEFYDKIAIAKTDVTVLKLSRDFYNNIIAISPQFSKVVLDTFIKKIDRIEKIEKGLANRLLI